VYNGCSIWGDYDNDGDLDLFISGEFGDYGMSILYRNQGGGFEDSGFAFAGTIISACAWGDYDNDGDLDLALSGTISRQTGSKITKIYRNDGDRFRDILAPLQPVWNGSLDWGDFDLDGDLDLLMTGGESWGVDYTRLYRNDGGDQFSNQEISLVNVSSGSARWGDYDNDGDLDILLTGWQTSDLTFQARIYRNNGAAGFSDIQAPWTGLTSRSAQWLDYDVDGQLDVLISGFAGLDENNQGIYLTNLYHNDGGDQFNLVTTNLPDCQRSAVDIADFDLDGDPDLLVIESIESADYARIYRNDGNGAFTDIQAGLPALWNGSADWGDFDLDSDLDFILTGWLDSMEAARLYRNTGTSFNTIPSTPNGLQVIPTGTGISFTWNPASDQQTPAPGLTYNLRVGTTPGGQDIVAPMADQQTGFRRLPAPGSQGFGTTALLKFLPVGTYYWSVQAVDGVFGASPFALEQTFTVGQYSVSGVIQTTSGAPLAGVMISDGAGHSVYSNAAGTYHFNLVGPAEYRITPQRTGCTFSPPAYRVSIPPSATQINFTCIQLLSTLPRVEITLNDYAPSPETVVATVGQTVIWQIDGGEHQRIIEGPPIFTSFLPLTMGKSGSLAQLSEQGVTSPPYSQRLFDSGNLEPGETFSYVFPNPGIYAYFSTQDPGTIRGRVQVVGTLGQIAADIPAGQAVELNNAEGVTVEIGASSLSTTTRFSILTLSQNVLPDNSGDPIGHTSVLEAGVLPDVLTEAITLTLPYSSDAIPPGVAETEILPYYYNGVRWIATPGTVDVFADQVELRTTHLSPWRLQAPKCRSAFNLSLSQTVAFDKGSDFFNLLVESRDVYEALHTIDGQSYLEMDFAAARWLAAKTLCDLAEISPSEIPIPVTKEELVHDLVFVGEQLLLVGQQYKQLNQILTILDTLDNAKTVYEVIEAGVQGATVVYYFLGANVSLVLEGAFYDWEMRDTRQRLDAWLQQTDVTAVGQSDLSICRLNEEQYELRHCSDCDFIANQPAYIMPIRTNPILSGDDGYSYAFLNLFENNGSVYFTLAVENLASFRGGVLWIDHSDYIFPVIEYRDTSNQVRVSLLNFKNTGFSNYGPFVSGRASLPGIRPGAEIYLKYLLVESGHLDRDYIPAGVVFPLAKLGKRLCYGPCQSETDGAIAGTVVDATNNQPIPSAEVCIQGTNQCDMSDEHGYFSLPGLAPGTYVVSASASGYIDLNQTTAVYSGETTTLNLAMSPRLEAGEIRIILTWGENPRDLDAHLWLPLGSPYHVYFSNKGNCGTSPWACLDVDDLNGLGPETITISKSVIGTYRFAVHRYSGSGTLTASLALVQVYDASGMIREFSVPTTGSGDWWYVFDFDGATRTVTPRNYITSVSPAPY
jgi:plastocyanin